MDYPSPCGVHVPETRYLDDPYRRPSSHRNRYSRSLSQTQAPHFRDVTWISSPVPTPQTPHEPPSSSAWLSPVQEPSTPVDRPPSPDSPSPAPTIGEHMTIDELFMRDDLVDQYQRPQRLGILRSFWKCLKKLSGFHPSLPSFRSSWYKTRTVDSEVPPPRLRALDEEMQHESPTPPGSGSGSGSGSGTEDYTSDTTEHSTTPHTSPHLRLMNAGATPAIIPGSLRASPVPVPSMETPPHITVISPSPPPSSPPHAIRPLRVPFPQPASRPFPVGAPDPGGSTQEASHTLYEPEPVRPPLMSAPIPMPRGNDDDNIQLPPSGSGVGIQVQAPAADRASSNGSFASTATRFKRCLTHLNNLPWVSHAQITDTYVPERTARSRLRARVRQGADPSWYTPRPEWVERPAYWSEWDTWAKQSVAALLDERRGGWAGVGAGGSRGGQGRGQWGVYPYGYVPAQPGFVCPWGCSTLGDERSRTPVLP